MRIILAVLCGTFWVGEALSHPGALRADGCHQQKTTGAVHCHPERHKASPTKGQMGGAKTPGAQLGIIKLTKAGICHPPQSPAYGRIKNFTPFPTIQACLATGGRLVKGMAAQPGTPAQTGHPNGVRLSTAGICHQPGSQHYTRMVKFTTFPTLAACIAAGGRQAKTSPISAKTAVIGPPVKLSKSGICHMPNSPAYARTKTFKSFINLQACLDAGGREAKSSPPPAPGGLIKQMLGPPVKRSKSGVCHPRGTPNYGRTKNYDAFLSMEACVAAGGRPPKK